MRARQLAVATVAIALALPPLAASASGDTSSDTLPKKAKKDFVSVVGDRLGEDGRPSKKLAIAAFEAAIGPLPGAPVKRVPKRSANATQALLLMAPLWDRLSPKQRRAAERRIHDRMSEGKILPLDGSNGPAGGSTTPAQQARLAAEIQQMRVELTRIYAPALGVPVDALMRFPLTVRVGRPRLGATVDNFLYTVAEGFENPRSCPGCLTSSVADACLLTTTADPARDHLRWSIYSCILWVGLSIVRPAPWAELLRYYNSASWVGYGGTWGAWDSWLRNGQPRHSTDAWFRQPTRPVAEYGVDAWPFYWLLAEDGLDPSVVQARQLAAMVRIPLPAITRAPVSGLAQNAYAEGDLLRQLNRAAWDATRAAGFSGAARIATSRLRQPNVGAVWAPNLRVNLPAVDVTMLIDGSRSERRQRSEDVTLRGTATATYRLATARTEVLEVLVDAPTNVQARIGFPFRPATALRNGEVTLFCLQQSCACPPGTPTPRMIQGRIGEAGVAVGNDSGDTENRSRVAIRLRARELTNLCPTTIITSPGQRITDDDVTPPVLTKLGANPSEISEVQCPPSEAGISAVATDESGIASVTMSWAFDAGFGHQSGSVEMARSGESQFSAMFGPYDIAVTTDVAIAITAVDTYGNPTTELVNVRLSDCPV